MVVVILVVVVVVIHCMFTAAFDISRTLTLSGRNFAAGLEGAMGG